MSFWPACVVLPSSALKPGPFPPGFVLLRGAAFKPLHVKSSIKSILAPGLLDSQHPWEQEHPQMRERFLCSDHHSFTMALVKIKESRSAADAKICIVASRSAADLLVCIVGSRSAAQGDALWHYVDSSSAATCKICVVTSRSAADVLVHFVGSRSAAGWQHDHPFQGKFG